MLAREGRMHAGLGGKSGAVVAIAWIALGVALIRAAQPENVKQTLTSALRDHSQIVPPALLALAQVPRHVGADSGECGQ